MVLVRRVWKGSKNPKHPKNMKKWFSQNPPTNKPNFKNIFSDVSQKYKIINNLSILKIQKIRVRVRVWLIFDDFSLNFDGFWDFPFFPTFFSDTRLAVESGAAPKRQRRIRAADVSEPLLPQNGNCHIHNDWWFQATSIHAQIAKGSALPADP